jgi:23S rRNA (cytidine1920-2'-O)/16S rRNA (cytidine1409-2'-O)-methyltransferase
MADRSRADQRLVDLGLADSRTRAQALIEAGLVVCDGRPVAKPSQPVPAGAVLQVAGADHPWVSRGGLKLEAGLDHFAIDPAGLLAADIGASTGGFTDVLLSRGAARVYAVDVGHDQLAPKLRADPRVVNLEGVNARALTAVAIPEPPALVVCDASFISLTLVLPAILGLAAPGAALVALVKPQFEVGRGRLGKGGVVRDPVLHREVCDRIGGWLAAEPGWSVLGFADSPVLGPAGNREFLIAGRKAGGRPV